MSLGNMTAGRAMAVATVLAIGASGTMAWAQGGDRSLTREGGAGTLTQVAMGARSIPPGQHRNTFLEVAYSDVRGLLTVTASPELTTWAILGLAVAPLGAAARLRRRWVTRATAV